MRSCAALLAFFLLALPPFAQAQRSFGTLTIVESEPVPAGPSPLSADRPADWRFVELVYAPLFMQNNAGQYAPYLAEGLTVEEDGRRIVVTLRDGLLWSTDRPVSAVDVVYTYELARIGKWNRAWIDVLHPVTSVHTASNGFDVVFELSRSVDDPGSLLTVPIVRAGLHGPLDVPERQRPSPMRVVGAGPYRLAAEGAFTTLTINPNAVRPPRISEVRFVTVGNRQLAADYVRLNGDAVTFDVAPADGALLTAEFGRRQLRRVGLELIALAFRPTDSPLGDPVVRQAVEHLLRRDELFAPAEGVTPTRVPVLPGDAAFPTDPPTTTFDPIEAERTLWWADWQREPHQDYFVRATEAGTMEELSLTLLLDADDRYAMRRAAILGERLRTAGIRLVLDPRPRQELRSRIRSGEFPAALVRPLLAPQQALRHLFHSDGGQNFLHFEHPEIDRLLEANDRPGAVRAIAAHCPVIILGIREVRGIAGKNLNAPLLQGRGGLARVDRWRIQ